jgi:hypothetical protein
MQRRVVAGARGGGCQLIWMRHAGGDVGGDGGGGDERRD